MDRNPRRNTHHAVGLVADVAADRLQRGEAVDERYSSSPPLRSWMRTLTPHKTVYLGAFSMGYVPDRNGSASGWNHLGVRKVSAEDRGHGVVRSIGSVLTSSGDDADFERCH